MPEQELFTDWPQLAILAMLGIIAWLLWSLRTRASPMTAIGLVKDITRANGTLLDDNNKEPLRAFILSELLLLAAVDEAISELVASTDEEVEQMMPWYRAVPRRLRQKWRNVDKAKMARVLLGKLNTYASTAISGSK